MAVITISRGSYSKGKEIAEKVARCLNYECVAREILLEASKKFNIPDVKLERALHDAPSVLQRFTYGKEKYITFIQASFLEHVTQDNVVYHGLAGHFFLKGVSHVLKVRVIADIEDRVRWERERKKINEDEALRILKKDDEERRKWSMMLYGIDTNDPSNYDLVIHIHKLRVDDAVDIICRMAQLPQFSATPESKQALEDLLVAARVKASLIDDYPTVNTKAKEGVVYVSIDGPESDESGIIEMVRNKANEIKGLKEVRVQVMPITLY
jgi:cytidylate kinase